MNNYKSKAAKNKMRNTNSSRGLWGNTNPKTKANLRNAKDARRSQEMTCPCAPHGMPSHRRGTVVQTTTEDADCRRRWELETELEQWPEKCLPGGDTAADDAITPGIFISLG